MKMEITPGVREANPPNDLRQVAITETLRDCLETHTLPAPTQPEEVKPQPAKIKPPVASASGVDPQFEVLG